MKSLPHWIRVRDTGIETFSTVQEEEVQRLTYAQTRERLLNHKGQWPDDLVMHKVRGLGAVRRGDLVVHERENHSLLTGHGFFVFLWRDAWCVTGDLHEIEDLEAFLRVGEDVMELEVFLQARCAA